VICNFSSGSGRQLKFERLGSDSTTLVLADRGGKDVMQILPEEKNLG
jgi:hypothetical protein